MSRPTLSVRASTGPRAAVVGQRSRAISGGRVQASISTSTRLPGRRSPASRPLRPRDREPARAGGSLRRRVCGGVGAPHARGGRRLAIPRPGRRSLEYRQEGLARLARRIEALAVALVERVAVGRRHAVLGIEPEIPVVRDLGQGPRPIIPPPTGPPERHLYMWRPAHPHRRAGPPRSVFMITFRPNEVRSGIGERDPPLPAPVAHQHERGCRGGGRPSARRARARPRAGRGRAGGRG